MVVEASRYTFRVTWSDEDGEFVATCVEFPSLSWLAPSLEDALTGLRDLVAQVIEDLRAEGADIAEPLSTRTYSGKFQLRLGPDLHRRLALQAAEEQLSLNQYVTRKLSSAS